MICFIGPLKVHEPTARHACMYIVISLTLSSMSLGAAQPTPSSPGRELMRLDRGSDACKGIVAQYLLNPRGEADGLFLIDGTQIHFPPHMSSELVRVIKAGDRVTAMGIRQNSKVFTAWQIIGDKNKNAVVDAGPSHPAGPPPPVIVLKAMQAQARVKAFLYGPKGDVNGFLLLDQTIVRMPPETAFSFSNVFQPGQIMSVRGNGSESSLGRCIEATSIGTDDQPMISIYDTDFARSSPPRRP